MKFVVRLSPLVEQMRQERDTAATIEQMRQERRARLKGGGLGESNGVTASTEPVALDAGVQKLGLNPRFVKPLHLENPTELEAVLVDIQTLVDRCHYHQLDILSRRESKNLRAVRGAAMQVARQRGRPKNTVNFAASQFGLGLAMIWWEQTGRRPTRYESERLRERGCFHEFVQLVVNELPPSLRQMPDGKVPSISYFVTASVKEFKIAMMSAAGYRHRGLIDEGYWQGQEDAVS